MTDTPCFSITRTFSAPRSRLWSAWTSPEALAQWFGPKETSGAVLEFDLRPGGMWRGRMEAPDGSAMYSKFVFREVEPMSRLVWVHGFADADGNRIRAPFAQQFPLEMLTTVLLADEGKGTRIDLSCVPLDATPEEEAFFASMMASMTGGWSGSFEQLDTFLATAAAA
ncbi:activator of HSP90 ATPase [Sphingosinicella microcystinivorans]|uniref:Activator of HSP90 ATPase n=1 Tax=Sphingosinicella microcystinivorans TaxID=335406 RepID=A0AAD1D5C2_SPHMI|nr:SRPBCC domain-containing protein [Sphingosinicella microcystinivorans]BBE34070.1 activator of HSP90 ATPase [Sphingosinicella microcystinivorans]